MSETKRPDEVPETGEADDHVAQWFRMGRKEGGEAIDVLKGLPLLSVQGRSMCYRDARGRLLNFERMTKGFGQEPKPDRMIDILAEPILVHAVLAAFAAGATAIEFGDGRIDFLIEDGDVEAS